MVQFNFKSPKTIGGEKTGKAGRPKGCKLVNKVHRDGESQKRFGHRSITTSTNKNKETPITHGYHLEDYKRRVVYEHYYADEQLPFYVGTGTLDRAFYFNGPRRHKEYIDKVKDINLIHVKIIAIDIDEIDAINLEKELCYKYKLCQDGGTLVNVQYGGRGGSRIKTNNKAIYQIDKNGNIVREFSSTKKAAYTLFIDPSSITKVLKGKAKHTKGYMFRYKNEGD